MSPPLVLLHGWALSAAVWDDLIPLLSPDREIHALDLPGHGRRVDDGRPGTLAEAAGDLAARLPQGCDLVGWSLGGLIALAAAAQYPEKIRRLVLVAASPRFLRDSGWPHAVSPEALEGMRGGIERDHRTTLARFLALQFHGVRESADSLRCLRTRLAAQPPSAQALEDGLDILARTDLREDFARLPLPVAVILGGLDTFAPKGVAEDLRALRPDARIEVIPHSGHAPFLSHPDEFLQALERALHG